MTQLELKGYGTKEVGPSSKIPAIVYAIIFAALASSMGTFFIMMKTGYHL